jgi:hypothetical protein
MPQDLLNYNFFKISFLETLHGFYILNLYQNHEQYCTKYAKINVAKTLHKNGAKNNNLQKILIMYRCIV